MTIISKQLSLPHDMDKRTKKKARSQRARHGFSDYDLMDGDVYLLGVLVGLLSFLENTSGYPEFYFAYATEEKVHCASFAQWEKELRRVRMDTEYLVYCYEHSYDNGDLQAFADKLNDIQMKVFVWLGHNLRSLWF